MKSKFLDNVLKFAIGPMGAALIGFITVPITTWLVTPDQYGMTTVFTIVQSLLLSFVYLGIDQSYVREFHVYKGNKANLLLNAALIPSAMTLVTMTTILIFAKPISFYLFGELNLAVIICLVIWLPFIVIERFILMNIRMNENGVQYSVYNILIKIFIMALTITLLLLYSQTYTSIIVASLLGQILADIIIIFNSRKLIQFNKFELDKQLIKTMLKFGLPLIPAVMINWLLNSTDRIVLDVFCSMHDIGIYFAAMKIVTALTMIQTIFDAFWVPMAYRWHDESVEHVYFTRVSYGIFIFMGLMFIGILLFKELFIFILSPDYKEAQYILPFLLFIPIMYTVSDTTSLGINFSRKTYLSVWISLIVASANLILNFLWVPMFGAVGAAMATGMSAIIYFYGRTFVSRKNWYSFKLSFYHLNILYLVAIAILNLVIRTKVIYFVNLTGLIGYVVLNFYLVKTVFDFSNVSQQLATINILQKLKER